MTQAQRLTSNAVVKQSPSSGEEDTIPESLAERRALHNSVERSRREALNSKFSHLAQLMPSLSHIHRPSKSVIISHCLDMVTELKDTKAENERLKQQLNQLRLSAGLSPMASQMVHRGSLTSSIESQFSPPLVGGGTLRTPSPSHMSGLPNGYNVPGSGYSVGTHPVHYRHSISGPTVYSEPGSLSYSGQYTSLHYPISAPPQVAGSGFSFTEPVDPRVAQLQQHVKSESNSTNSGTPDASEGHENAEGSNNHSYFPVEYAQPMEHGSFSSLDYHQHPIEYSESQSR